MNQYEFFLPSHSGEGDIKCFLELPEGEVRGVLQICHGMCEYFGRYRDFVNFIKLAGFAVCGHDHIGHGESAQDGKFGYFGKKDGHRTLALDAHALTVYVREKLPGKPFFLLGHSMGSFVSRDYITQYGRELDGVILMGTAGPNPALGAGKALAAAIIATKGELHRSDLINNIAFGSYCKKIENARSRYDWLSRDMKTVVEYSDDRYCNFIFTARGFLDLFTLLERVNAPKWATEVPKSLPILLVAGDADPVGDYGKGVQTVYHRLEKAGVEDVILRLYPDMRHEILNELGREAVYTDLLLWLEKRLKMLAAADEDADSRE